VSDSKPPTIPKPIGRQSSHSPEEIAQAQAVMEDVVREHISGENPLPADYEPEQDRRDHDAPPRRAEDIEKARVPLGWLIGMAGILLGGAGGLLAAGTVWGQATETVVQAQKDATAAATAAAETAKAIPVLQTRTDAGAEKLEDHEKRLGQLEQNFAKFSGEQREAHKAQDEKLDDLKRDMKELLRTSRK
jgi:hypothetical protein